MMKDSSATERTRAPFGVSLTNGANPSTRLAKIRSGIFRATPRPRKNWTRLLTGGDPEAAGIAQGVIEGFARELSLVIQRFLNWRDAERLVIGGGFRGRRVGELAIGRATVLLKAEKIKVETTTIHNEPDEAGLLGAIQGRPGKIESDGRIRNHGRHA
jgi:hypothetical protein